MQYRSCEETHVLVSSLFQYFIKYSSKCKRLLPLKMKLFKIVAFNHFTVGHQPKLPAFQTLRSKAGEK